MINNDLLKQKILDMAIRGMLVKNNPDEKSIDDINGKTENVPFEIPCNWKWTRIGDVASLTTGNSINAKIKADKYSNSEILGYDYIGTKDVSTTNKINYITGVKIPFEEGFKVAQKNSILMCIEGGSAGKKIGYIEKNVCYGNKLCNFHSNIIDNKYLYYYLQTKVFSLLFQEKLNGIIGGVSVKKIKEIFLPIPPIDEQKRIIEKLELVNDLIDKKQKNDGKILKLKERLKHVVLDSAYKGALKNINMEFLNINVVNDESLELYTLPNNWKWSKIKDVCTKIVDGDHNPAAGENVITNYLMLSAININNNKLNTKTNIRYLSEENYKKINNRTKVSLGDVLLSIVGTIGRSCIYDIDANITFQRSVAIITTNINNKYLKYYLDCPYAQRYMSNGSAGAVQKGFYLRQLAEMPVPLPSVEEQKKIVDKIEKIFDLIDKL